MKSITTYINEALKLGKLRYKYYPKTKEELKALIKQRIEQEGNEVNLNDIDVSEITDMFKLFMGLDFNGDISSWDVSNVNDMTYMFYKCKKFNQDLSTWDVSKVTNMTFMFDYCKKFNQDISNWDVSNVEYYRDVFKRCPIKKQI